ncbi:MAG TPA: bifunctional lysylphosphatidylglycerol flippase/synthetase MprF [Aliidongia sp.]|uniref:bifunctional lysylphosphatidylglycerol flippase/synthetase MprF n=1 Tax=Aliidongia sp. TaxID=1914230 RepID=UPI002DDC91C7|nr:bifunctional lysylphosphatidylglycerol flippase/synthetase MprF [Aliidongia sp.]HEV2672963.1 bifunctional lysylphosphatidylglycerol flippase/synthetase MprF [Aliidongia sp.]
MEEVEVPADGPQGAVGLLRRLIAPVTALVACGIVLALLHGLSHGIDYHAMIRAMRRTPNRLLLWSAGATAISYAALVARDVCALRYVGAKIPASALLLGSFCGSALGNAVGFGALTGGAVRYRAYGAVGVQPDQITRIMLFITAGFGIGLAAYAGASVVFAGKIVGHLLHLSVEALHAGGIAVLVATALVIVFCGARRTPIRFGQWIIEIPGAGLTLAQILLTAIDLAGAAAALWLLLPADGRVDFATFSAIYAAATALGVLSHVPGGIGVFEAVVVFSLGSRVSPSLAAAALLAYRAVYFLLPLMLAGVLLAAYELTRLAGRTTGTTERVLRGAGLLAPIYLSVMTFFVGVMLIVSGATPAFGKRLAALHDLFPLWAVEMSNFFGSLAGVLLLFVARGLYHRLDGAWWLALLLAFVNLGLSIGKGLAWDELAFISFFILMLLSTRRQFSRPASFLRQPFTVEWFVGVAVVLAGSSWILFFAFRDVAYTRDLWWHFEFDEQAPRALRALFGMAVLALVLGTGQLLRTAPGRVAPPSPAELGQVEKIIGEQGRSEAMLAMMGDKSFLFSASGQSFLMYAKRGRSWVALYDPVGPRAEWPELIWRFVELADEHGGRAAFYQVRADSLPLYLDAGLKILKLGEEAIVPLADFTLQGGRWSGLRYALKRGEREGLTLEMLTPEAAQRRIATLTRISDAWLAARRAKEKSFSVAAFEPSFIAAHSVALLSQSGDPVAFVSLMTTDRRTEATVGIMRHTADASPYAMEFLFTCLAQRLREDGFERLSLGMAPLSGIGRTPLASRWHSIAGLVWEHGGRVYNFQGLRTFKNKFHPLWEPRYLAASGAIGPFVALADVVVLAGSSKA